MYGENKALAEEAQAGNGDALDQLIRINMGLVRSIALRFRDRGTDYEDLVQIGVIGMIKAAKSYDPGYNTEFSTYAVPLVIGEIRRFLRDDGMIKVGRGLKRLGTDAMKKREKFLCEKGREPKLSELAELCGASPEDLSEALEATFPVHSISESPKGDGDGPSFESLIASKENEIDRLTDSIALREAINALPEKQRKLIILRYFREMSQQKTGEILNMTQVKVSREEKKIMEKLARLLG